MAPVTAHYVTTMLHSTAATPPTGRADWRCRSKSRKDRLYRRAGQNDNVYLRMESVKKFAQRTQRDFAPKWEWLADGTVMLTLASGWKRYSRSRAIEIRQRMG
jgi:hypothetical protein